VHCNGQPASSGGAQREVTLPLLEPLPVEPAPDEPAPVEPLPVGVPPVEPEADELEPPDPVLPLLVELVPSPASR
jgi:hypothetical protein